MFTPRHFAETDLAGLDALFARDPFATLVTVADGAREIAALMLDRLARRPAGDTA